MTCFYWDFMQKVRQQLYVSNFHIAIEKATEKTAKFNHIPGNIQCSTANFIYIPTFLTTNFVYASSKSSLSLNTLNIKPMPTHQFDVSRVFKYRKSLSNEKYVSRIKNRANFYKFQAKCKINFSIMRFSVVRLKLNTLQLFSQPNIAIFAA